MLATAVVAFGLARPAALPAQTVEDALKVVPKNALGFVLVNRLADVASTVALFAMGMSLWRYGLRGNIRAGLLLSALKLLLQPALVLILVRTVAPMPASWARVAVLASACPTGVNAYLVAARFRTGEALASNAITLSTALATIMTGRWTATMRAIGTAPSPP